MPSLQDLIHATMIGAAARGGGVPLERREPGQPIARPRPEPLRDHDAASTNAIWSWTHQPARPRQLHDITVRSRGMGMLYGMPVPVARRIEFGDVRVHLRGRQGGLTLPLEPAFMHASFCLPHGRVAPATAGLWQLESEVDASLLLVFAYKLVGDAIAPLGADEIAALGDRLVPDPPVMRALKLALLGESAVRVELASPRFVACVSLTCCKERNDVEPGGILGGARLYPHVVLTSSVALDRVETSVTVERPASAMTHGDESMKPEIRPLLVADTNLHSTVPLAYWDKVFDYVEDRPFERFVGRPGGRAGGETREAGEVCLVDPDAPEREIEGAVETLDKKLFGSPYEPRTILKRARQGEFDSLHVAPRMRHVFDATGGDGKVTLDDIVMAPFCVHDCLHMHVRWGPLPGPFSAPVAMRGFSDASAPYLVEYAPLVPTNQHVFLRLDSHRQFRYRAVARGPISAGIATCFMHHGLFYAIDLWPSLAEDAKGLLATQPVFLYAALDHEPYTRFYHLPEQTFGTGWAAFYWRLRYGGSQHGTNRHTILERLRVLDPDRCLT